MSQIDDAINWLNDLDIWAQWCVGATATLLVLGLFRLILKSVILDFVKRTPFEWDDKLYKPVSKEGIFPFNRRFSNHNEMGSRRWIFLGCKPRAVFPRTGSYLSITRRLPENYDPCTRRDFRILLALQFLGSNSLIIFILRAAAWFVDYTCILRVRN